jgi:hypothetical protein
MQLATTSARQASKKDQRMAADPMGRHAANQSAVDEINAYIAVRDGLLDETEAAPTSGRLDRLAAANEFVVNCLKPARSPYEAQYLSEMEAACERKRCEAVQTQIAKWRAQISCAA